MVREGKTLSTQYVKDFYDNYVKGTNNAYGDHRWNSNIIARNHYWQTRQILLRAFDSEESLGEILEIGCGAGTWTSLFSEKCEKLTAMDISHEMLEIAAKQDYPKQNVEFIYGNFPDEENLNSKKYDMVVLVRSFEYFPDKLLALKKIFQLLDRNGKLVIITKNPGYLGFRVKNIMKESELLHLEQISHKDLTELCSHNLFNSIIVRPAVIHIPGIFFRKTRCKFNEFLFKKNYFLGNEGSLLSFFIESYCLLGNKDE